MNKFIAQVHTGHHTVESINQLLDSFLDNEHQDLLATVSFSEFGKLIAAIFYESGISHDELTLSVILSKIRETMEHALAKGNIPLWYDTQINNKLEVSMNAMDIIKALTPTQWNLTEYIDYAYDINIYYGAVYRYQQMYDANQAELDSVELLKTLKLNPRYSLWQQIEPNSFHESFFAPITQMTMKPSEMAMEFVHLLQDNNKLAHNEDMIRQGWHFVNVCFWRAAQLEDKVIAANEATRVLVSAREMNAVAIIPAMHKKLDELHRESQSQRLTTDAFTNSLQIIGQQSQSPSYDYRDPSYDYDHLFRWRADYSTPPQRFKVNKPRGGRGKQPRAVDVSIYTDYAIIPAHFNQK